MSVDRVEIRAQAILDQADERWRDVLQQLLIAGLTTYALATFFAGASLERQGEFAIVRVANAFARDHVARSYRTLVAQVLAVPPSRVVIALAGQKVELEPEPVEEES